MTTNTDIKQSFFVFVKDTNTGRVKRVAIPGDVQIGMTGRPAELQLLGRLSLASKTFNSNAAVINVSNNDTIVNIANASGSLSKTLHIPVNLPPTPRDGQVHFFKDLNGMASVNPIDLYPALGSMIDGAVTGSITVPYGTVSLYWMNGGWRTLSQTQTRPTVPVATFAKSNDTSSGAVTAETIIGMVGPYVPGVFGSTYFIPSTSLTGDATNNAVITVYKRSAGGNRVAIATLTTLTSWTAWVPVQIPIVSATVTALSTSDVLTFDITKNAAGVVVPAGQLNVYTSY